MSLIFSQQYDTDGTPWILMIEDSIHHWRLAGTIMSNKKGKNKKRHKPRNLNAISAHFRSAGPMKDKRTPRKQNKNWQRDHKDETNE